jgi:hypothetical protein
MPFKRKKMMAIKKIAPATYDEWENCSSFSIIMIGFANEFN